MISFMATKLKTSLYFPDFKLNITSNDRGIFDLIIRHFPSSAVAPNASRAALTIHGAYHRTRYSLLPHSRCDCFHGFTLFYNQFRENRQLHLDAGPRTIRTTVDPQHDTITSFVATPPDIEKDLLFDLIFFQPLKCLLQLHGFYLFHSSFVSLGDKGVLFTGKSGSGKSILAMALSKMGFDYLADDEVILRESGSGIQCAPFSSFPKIRKSSLYLFPEFKKAILKSSGKNDKAIIDAGRAFPKAMRRKAKPLLLIFPRYAKSSKVRMQTLNKHIVLSRLIREEFLYIKPGSRHVSGEYFKVLSGLLHQVKAYRLYYNDQNLDKACGMVRDLLEKS